MGAAGGRSHSETVIGSTVRSATAEQLSRQVVQVHLLAQLTAERLDGGGGVVAAPVEAPVHGLLDTAAGRLEQRGDHQGRGRHGQAGPAPRSWPSPSTTPT
jgi:hypothetical protein